MQNVNLIVTLHSELCGCILTDIALTLYNRDKGICALLLIIRNVQNVNLFVAMYSALIGSILAAIA